MIAKWRFLFLVGGFFLFFLVILTRLLLLFEPQETLSPASFSEKGIRGLIYDRKGNLLSGNKKLSSIFVHPEKLDEEELEYHLDPLASLLSFSKNSLLEQFKPNRSFIWLKRKIQNEIAEKVKDLKLKGVFFKDEYKREYPFGNLASHVLGFTGIDNIGLEGLEYYFDSVLNPNSKKRGEIFGENLHTTLDLAIQESAEQVLQKGVLQHQAQGGTLIVMDSSTAEILALANYPSFDGNQFSVYSKNYFRNSAITDYYEPGSIFKIFIAAFLLEEGLILPDEEFYCSGEIKLHGRTITCPRPHGNVNLEKILQKSCNVGIIKASLRISPSLLYHYLKEFRFGEKTNIALHGESSGVLREEKKWNLLSRSMISFGYEIGLSPIQMVRSASALVNGGYLYEPRLIQKITNSFGTVQKFFPKVSQGKLLSDTTRKRIQTMLRSVVQKGGTGELAQIKGIPIYGKTSTVNVYDQEISKYSQDRVYTSFLGFVPQILQGVAHTEKHTFVVFVLIREPQFQKFARVVAAPIFHDFVLRLLDQGIWSLGSS